VETEVTERMAAFRADVEKLNTAHEEQLREERGRVQELLEAKARAEAKHVEDAKAVAANHSKALKELDEACKRQLQEMTVKLEQLTKDREREEKAARERLEEERRRHEEADKALTVAHSKELEAQRTKYTELEKKFLDEQELHEAEIRQ
jgi:hypothetical protein